MVVSCSKALVLVVACLVTASAVGVTKEKRNRDGSLMGPATRKRRSVEKDASTSEVSILPDGKVLELTDDAPSRAKGMGSSQIEIGSDGKASLQIEGGDSKRLIRRVKKLVDPPEADDDNNKKYPAQDLMTVGLSKEDAEKERETRAVMKAEEMAQALDLAGDVDHEKASHLKHELLNGMKGEKVMEEIIDVEDSVHPGPEVDDLVRSGAALTSDDYVALERYETGDPNIQDPEEVGEEGEDQNSTLAQEGSWQSAVAEGPIMKLMPAEQREDLMRMLEKSTQPNQTARLRELNKTHHLFVGIRAKGPNKHRIWPKKRGRYTIKYCRGPSLSNRNWRKFKEATGDVQKSCTALDFRLVGTGSGCELVIKGTDSGCWAHVGYVNGQNQLNLGFLCATKGIATHELLHALGQHHEQARSDRNRHATVYYGNIKAGKAKQNFDVAKGESTLDAYDLESIMHYGCTAFSKNLMHTVDGHRRRRFWDWAFGNRDCWYQMGQRSGMTSNDIRQLKRMYSCQSAPVPACRRRWFKC